MVRETIYVSLSIITFSVVHSLTASMRFKNRIKNCGGERIYEGWFCLAYNIVSLLSLAPILYFLREPSSIIWSVVGLLAVAFNVIRIIGVISIFISLWQIDWLIFIGIRQIATILTINQHLQAKKYW